MKHLIIFFLFLSLCVLQADEELDNYILIAPAKIKYNLSLLSPSLYNQEDKILGFSKPSKVCVSRNTVGIKLKRDLNLVSSVYFGLGSLSDKRAQLLFEDVKKMGSGAKAGLWYNVNDTVFFDFFVDYTHSAHQSPVISSNSGLHSGVGLGITY